MKLLVVVNRHAGSGRAGRLQRRVSRAFAARGVAADWQETRAPGHAAEWVARADLGGYDAVVAAGGDGTLFEVLNGLCLRDPSERIPLGVVPLGTGNAFARDLGLGPADWAGAVRAVAGGRLRRVDVGRVETATDRFHFLNVTGAGFVVAAGRWAQRLRWAGSASYTLGAVLAMARLASHPFRVELDGERLEQDSLLLEVSNSRYTGTHFLVAPAARLDDGMLVVTLVRRLTRRRLLRLFPSIYRGTHVGFDEVTVRKARRVRIAAPAGLQLSTDGEFRGSTPADIVCLPGEVEFIAPAG